MEKIWHSILLYLYDKSIIEFEVYIKLKDILNWNWLKIDEYLFSFKECKKLGEKTYNFLSKLLILLWEVK